MKKKEYDFHKECKVFAFVMAIILLLIMTAGILDICGVFDRPEEPVWKPTVIYPMTNAHVTWLPTYYGGAMKQ